MSSKIVLIGLEAAEPSLLEQWCDEGHLPVLASLRERWPWFRMMSSTDISSGATWPSVFSGASPAKHGIGFYHRQLKTGTYQPIKKYADQVKRDPFWVLPSQAGKKIAIFDVPVTYPMKQFNGVHIGGWGVEAPSWRISSKPDAMMRDIKKRFGRHPLEGWYQTRPGEINQWRTLLQNLIHGGTTKWAISNNLLDQDSWDLLFTVFSESHWAGHFFWHLMDKDHPEHLSEPVKVLGDMILNVYRELDKGLSAIVDNLSETTVIIFSNTGMGPNYSGSHLLPEILKRLEMTGNHENGASFGSLTNLLPTQRWGPNAVKAIESMVGPKRIEQVRRWVPERLWDTWTRRILHLGNNWRNSRAFLVPSDYTGAIRINLKGRESHGLVGPGKDYDDLCDELTREFGALINPETGKAAVSRIFRVDRMYEGENIGELPDLIVRWTGDAPVRALSSPRIGTVYGNLSDNRTGAHRPHGFLVAAGKHIRQGRAQEEGNIMDIAPTILYLMGQPIPRDMDGKVLLDIIDKPFQAKNPVRYIGDPR